MHHIYPHADGRYVDAIIHGDPADEESGCLTFLDGSHKLGPLEHVRESSLHLPQDQYRLEDAVSSPAGSGDVVLFSVWTIHGSALNHRSSIRVHGVRPKIEDVTIDVYSHWGRRAQAPQDED
jgi:phytanoyl-CoA hydroxylase